MSVFPNALPSGDGGIAFSHSLCTPLWQRNQKRGAKAKRDAPRAKVAFKYFVQTHDFKKCMKMLLEI
jgi:hypothetical protein